MTQEEKEYNDRWRKNHPDKIKKYKRRYYRKHINKNRENCHIYYQNHKKEAKEYYQKNREQWMILIHELGMDKCSNPECGYDKCFAAIDFHHRNPKEKEFNIGKIIDKPITPKRVAELKKTNPLCSNCHREFHYLERINGEHNG